MAGVSVRCLDHIGYCGVCWCRERDSNPHLLDSESSASTNWATAAKNGGSGGSRTRNLRIKSPLLLPVELPTRVMVGVEGLAPSASRVRAEYSTIELHTHELEPPGGFAPPLPIYETGVLGWLDDGGMMRSRSGVRAAVRFRILADAFADSTARWPLHQNASWLGRTRSPHPASGAFAVARIAGETSCHVQSTERRPAHPSSLLFSCQRTPACCRPRWTRVPSSVVDCESGQRESNPRFRLGKPVSCP